MAGFFTQTAKLVPYAKRPRGATGFVTAFSDEPRADDPAFGLGNFYAVIEVVSGGREAEETVQITLQTAEEVYYSPEGPEEVLERFELATKAVNRALTEYVNAGNAGWVGKMSGVLAVLNGQDLHVAYTGSAEAFLYRGPHSTRITVQPHNRVQQPSKIFGSIASGTMEVGDKLLLATPALVHHISLSNLKTIVSENPPASAIAKMTEQLSGQGFDRVAGLILEFSTPELAAQQPQPEIKAETVLTAAPSVLQTARQAASPLIGEATTRSVRLAGQAARSGLPKLKQGGWLVAGLVRPILQNPRQRLYAGGVAAAVIVAASWGLMSHSHSQAKSDIGTQIHNLVNQANTDQDKVINQDTSVRADLVNIQIQLRKLDTKSNQSAWQSEGTNPKTLANQIQSDINQLDHVVDVKPTTVASTADLGSPSLVAVAGQDAITVSSNGKIGLVNLSTGKTALAGAKFVGKPVAVASADKGIYILTDQPSVWLYQPSNDSLSQISGGWQAGKALASYSGNLYELEAAGVTKRVTTLAGFSAGQTALGPTVAGVNSATAMAVDGSIYIGGPEGIFRYLAGSLTGHAELPAGFSRLTTLVPGNGDYILAVDKSAGRVAVLSSQASALNISGVYVVPNLASASIDVSGGRIITLNGSHLLSYALPR